MKTKLFFTLLFFILSFLSTDLLAYVPPANDNCVDAIEITDLSSCNSIHVDGTDATSENNTTGCNIVAADVWYKFTATSERMKVRGLAFSAYGSEIQYELYSGGCNVNNRIDDSCFWSCEDCAHTFESLTVGTEYYIRVWFLSGTEADICIEETCNIDIVTHNVSTCDNTENTYDLLVEISATGLNIGDSLVLTSYNGGEADNGLKITNNSETFIFSITGIPANGNLTGFSIREWNGGCQQYFDDFYTAPSACVSPPANDDCANAIELTNFSTCTTLHLSGIGATASSLVNTCDAELADIWYKFTATSTRMEIKAVEFSDYDNSVIIYEVYTDACNGMNRIGDNCWWLGYWCENCSHELTNLTIGEEYYLRVAFNQGQEADICIQDVCDITVTNHTVGTCDNVDNTYDLIVDVSATGLEVGDSLILYVESVGVYADEGFKITSSTETFNFIVSGLVSTGDTKTFNISEWNGGCNQVFFDYYTAPSACVSPPVNNTCSGAIELTDFSECSTVHVSTIGATSGANGCNPNGLDVWYKFTATSPRMEIRGTEFTDYGDSAFEYEIYTDGCGGMTRLDNTCWNLGYWCEDCPRTISGLTVGNEYYLGIWFFQGQEADICLQDICDISITNHSVGICDNGDNTYDLTVNISTVGLEVGDSLVVQVADNSYRGGQKITSASGNYTLTATGLPSTGEVVSIYILEYNGGCFKEFVDLFMTPAPCVSPPSNDECINAIAITDLSTCNILPINVVGATANSIDFTCNRDALDVWYKFTATSTKLVVEGVEFSDYGDSQVLYEIYSACGTTARINDTCYGADCEGCRTLILGLTLGEEYYLRAWMTQGIRADICLQTQCEMTITNHSVTTCDNGDNTYDLTVEVSGEGFTVGDSLVLNVSGFGLADTGFKITSASQSFIFIKTGLPATGNTVSLLIHEWEGNCSEYYNDFYTAPAPCVSAPVNDDCEDAIEVLTSSIPDTFQVSSLRATPSDGLTNSCFDNTSRDVWYKFTAASTRIGLRGIDFSISSIQEFEIYQDGCNATSRLGSCVGICENCYLEFEGLTIGAEYYIRFSFYEQEVEAEISIENLCDFEIISTTPSACDPVDNTFDLSIEFSLTNAEIGDEILSYINGGGGFLTINDIQSSYTIVVENIPATNTPISIDLTNITQNCSEYFYHYTTAPVPCVVSPDNNDCQVATTISDLTSCNVIHYNNYGSSGDIGIENCNQSGFGVWYEFTANVNEVEVNAVDLASYDANYGISMELHTGTCNNLTLIDCWVLCENNCNRILNNLIIGQKYFFRIISSRILEGDICVQAPNGDICNDQSLNLDMSITNQATYQTQQTITAEGMIPNTENTTFIAEQSITLMPGFHAQAGAEFHAYIEACTPVSPFVETPAAAKVTPTTATPLVADLTVAPNPFRYSTTLKYTLEQATAVNLQIYSMSGKLVQELVTAETQQAGVYEYTFEPKENTSNFYFAVMTTSEQVITKKMIFIR